MRSGLAVMSLVVTLAGAGSGCSTSGRVPPFVAGDTPSPDPSTTCPFGIRGARVSTSDTDDGVAITVRAYGDLEEVRRRAHDAAAMYGPGAHRGLGHDGKHGGGERHGLGLAELGVPARAEALDTPDGALILVRPRQPADLDRMREALATREGRVRRGECP